jgi:hypothetical protein
VVPKRDLFARIDFTVPSRWYGKPQNGQRAVLFLFRLTDALDRFDHRLPLREADAHGDSFDASFGKASGDC